MRNTNRKMKIRMWGISLVSLFLLALLCTGITIADESGPLIQIDTQLIQLAVGQTQKVSYSVQAPEEWGRVQKARWDTSDDGVAAVKDGTIRAVSAGEASVTLTVPFENGKEETAIISVRAYQPVQSITTAEKKLTLNAGEMTEPIVPILKPENATFTEAVLSSADETIVSVESGNCLLALKAGKTTVTVTTNEPVPNKGKPKTAAIQVTVLQPALQLSAETDKAEIGRGRSITLPYLLLPKDVSNPKLTWKSSDDKIAVVSNGKVTGKGSGNVIITAATTDGTNLEASWNISVFEPVTGITLDQKKIELQVGNKSEPLVCHVLPEEAKYQDVEWISSNEYVATVNEEGVITARHAGNTTITAISCEPADGKSKAKSAAVSVTVRQPEIAPHSDDYVIQDGTLTAYNGSDADIVIPDGVTYISGWCFSGNTNIVSVSVPETVIEIGQGAFYNCSSLETVNIPDGITILGYQIFCGCSSLKEIIIPDSVRELEENVFYGCGSLQSLVIPPNVKKIGNAAFYKCAGLSEIVLPEKLDSLGYAAFSGCENLKAISIPDGISIIERETFENCKCLTEVRIPSTVHEIDSSAFYNCDELQRVILPNGIQQIGAAAFSSCEKLENLSLPRTLTDIGNYAFSYCGLQGHITLPDSLKSIGKEAFSYCGKLTKMTVPENVNSIGENAFNFGNNEFTIRGAAGSCAETYASENSILFEQADLDGEAFHQFRSGKVLAWLKALPDKMETVRTDGTEDILLFSLAEEQPEQMISGFSIYQPTVQWDEIHDKIRDLTQSADKMIFRMYDFQRNGFSYYDSRQPVHLDRIQQFMKNSWLPFSDFDFAAGAAAEGEIRWYWIPVYYKNETQEIQNDEVYLYILRIQKGPDAKLLEEMGVYYPFTGEYRTEEFLISDKEEVCALFDAMSEEYDYYQLNLDETLLRTLRSEDTGGDVSDIQTQLVKQGLMEGSVDGFYGESTMDAIRLYQQGHQLEETGEANPHLQIIILGQEDEKEMLKQWMIPYKSTDTEGQSK